VLSVDDDPEVHAITALVLKHVTVDHIPIALHAVPSAEDARLWLAQHTDTAVVLADVVMESERSGLELVRSIREELGQGLVRVLLRTGQPGDLDETEVMQTYDIHDYLAKGETSARRLRTSIIGAIRAYRDLCALREWRAMAIQREAFEEGFRALLAQMPLGLAIHRDRRLLYVNPALLALLQREDDVPTAVDELLRPSDGDGLLSDATVHAQTFLVHRDGRAVPVEIRTMAIRYEGAEAHLTLFHDLTRRRLMETRLMEADRMVVIGTLAAGIAHEINTPVQFVSHSAHFLREAMGALTELIRTYRAETADSPCAQRARALAEEIEADFLIAEVPRALDRTLEGLDRVANIVRAMRDFGHPGPPHFVSVDLVRVLERTLVVAEAELRRVATLEVDVSELPHLQGDPAALGQVFLNLLINAAQAVADAKREEGRIRVAACARDGRVEVSVSDNGCGIPAAHQARIFDPFFTTKEVGRGTGQGLTIARNIVVERHHGRIEVESREGEGSTFRVILPVDRGHR
jgi:signal transduction histidine kinase